MKFSFNHIDNNTLSKFVCQLCTESCKTGNDFIDIPTQDIDTTVPDVLSYVKYSRLYDKCLYEMNMYKGNDL